jgi:nitroreductase
MIEKTATTEFPVHELLSRRWSPRAFCDRPVEREKLLSVLEAARWAPSSNNEQPWGFLLATKDQPKDFERMLSCLVEANQVWANRAPILMLSVARLRFRLNGKPNRHAMHDVGMAVGNLAIQATALDLVVHQMAGISPDKARELFGIPEDCEVVAAIALGYPADSEVLPERLRERELAPRARKPLEEFVFSGHWGQPSEILPSGH